MLSSMTTLEGKVAVVTGAGRNVGRGIALALAAAGADVAVLEVDPTTGARTAEEVQARGARSLAVECDVTSPSACAAAIDRVVGELGGIDVLVNNAQRTRPWISFLETTEEDMRVAWESGTLATFRLMHLCHPHLVARGGGAVVNFGSSAGTAGLPGFTAYASAKEAIRALTKVTAQEWGRDGITVNTICPAAYEGGEDPPYMTDAMRATRPIPRMGHPEHDIGAAVVYLATAGRYVTGQTLMVDGGAGVFR
jgi:NAD(P)-dependent dehydrogenase (short-subunit alcohol dehydrogenase family)